MTIEGEIGLFFKYQFSGYQHYIFLKFGLRKQNSGHYLQQIFNYIYKKKFYLMILITKKDFIPERYNAQDSSQCPKAGKGGRSDLMSQC